MTPPNLDRRVSQNRHDIEEIYLKIDQTNETVARIAAAQQEHGTILARHSVKLDEHSTKLDSHSAILESHTAKLDEHSAILAEHTVTLADHGTKLDEILTILRARRGDT